MRSLAIVVLTSSMLAVGCTKEDKCADSGCGDSGVEQEDTDPASLSFGISWTDCVLNVQVTNADQDHTMAIVGANFTGEACSYSTMTPGECKTVIDGSNRFNSVNDGRMGDPSCGDGLEALDEETTWYTVADADDLTYAFFDEDRLLVDCQGANCAFFAQ